MKALLFILLFLPISLLAQNQSKIDSLNIELNRASNDSLKIEIYSKLFTNYYQYDPAKAKEMYEEILNLARLRSYNRGFYKGYFAAGSYYAMIGKYDSSLFYLYQANEFVNEFNDDNLTIENLLAISHIHLWKNELDEAKEMVEKSLEIAKRLPDSTSLALSFKQLGEIYNIKSKLDSAVFFYLSAIKILEKNGKEKSKLGDLFAGIGEVYLGLNNSQKAEEFLHKSIDQFKKIDDYDGIMFASAILGGAYFHNKEYEDVIKILNPVLEYYESVGDPYRISETNRVLGLSYLYLDKYFQAEKHIREAVEKGRETGEPINLADALIAYGDLNLKIKRYDEVSKFYLEAEGLYGQAQFSKGILKSAQMLSKLYEESGDYKNAHTHLGKYLIMKDSLDKDANANFVQQLEVQYQNENKQNQIELLKTQNLLKEQEAEIQKNIFIAGILAAFILIGVFYSLLRFNKRAHKKLKELDTLKSRFFANISHEFRTPLTLISGPIEQKLKDATLDDHEKADLQMINRNSKQLLSLVDQLLDLSKIESGGYQVKIEKGDISEQLMALASSFEYAAKQKRILYKVSILPSSTETWFDKDALQKITVNLLSNALKFTPEKGLLNFTAEIAGENLILVCENSGTGIPLKNQHKIFERFYQQNGEAGGTGIGLSLVKELTDLLNGKISVKSVPDESTTFKIMLPIEKEAFPKHLLVKTPDPERVLPELTHAINGNAEQAFEEVNDEEQPILLIVDDNKDIIRFVKSIFQNDYKVLEAHNGKNGIEMAIKHIPDIIISDIMMPGTDGIELCRHLKTDERTSHIPIILLTAKAGDENKLIGFETGADDYITKPFNSDVLKVRIAKLIEIRKRLQERFSQEVVLKPKDIALTSADQIFLEKVQQILDLKLTDSDFTAESFSRDLGMSRMQLHRKLTGLTGLSANHFIRMYRLKLASTLLSSPGINISEVGYMAGFNNPSYFAKCFKEFYKCTPKEYAHNLPGTGSKSPTYGAPLP